MDRNEVSTAGDTRGSRVRSRVTHRILGVRGFPFHVTFAAPEGASAGYSYEWGPFATKPGASGVLIRIETDDGLVGWGEASMVFHPYQPATILEETIAAMAGYLIGRDPFQTERLTQTLYAHAGWHFSRDFANYAIGGIEMALYDLIGKASGLSLSELLGGRLRDEIPFMYFLYRDELPNTIAEAQRAVAAGFQTLYFKVGVDSPQEDLQRIAALRDAVGDRIQIRVDANENWSPGKAVRMIRAFEEYDLEFVEQPVLVQDVEGLATVRRRVRTPIAADQAARTTHQLLRIIRSDAADVVCSDPGSAGGIGAARKHAAIAEAAGLPMFIHSNVELGIGTAAIVHLAAAFVTCTYASQTEYQFVRERDVLNNKLTFTNGKIAVPTGPGLGIEVNEDAVAALADAFRERETTRYSLDVGDRQMAYLPSY